MWTKSLLLLTVILGVCACGSGEDSTGSGNGSGSASICRLIGGGTGAVTTAPATTATFTNATRAFDADLSSFAVLNTTGGTGTSSIQGNEQSGIVEPANEIAGIVFSATTDTISSNSEVTITTYLNGTQQETGAASTTSRSDALKFFGLKTTKPFNQVKATLALVNDSATINIYELCVQ